MVRKMLYIGGGLCILYCMFLLLKPPHVPSPAPNRNSDKSFDLGPSYKFHPLITTIDSLNRVIKHLEAMLTDTIDVPVVTLARGDTVRINMNPYVIFRFNVQNDELRKPERPEVSEHGKRHYSR